MSLPTNLLDLKKRELSKQPGIFGDCTLFDGLCGDNQLLSMFNNANSLNAFVQLFPPTPTKLKTKRKRYITQMRGTVAAGADPVCDVPTGTVEQSLCDLQCDIDPADMMAVSGPERRLSDEGAISCDTSNITGRFIDGTAFTSTAQLDRYAMLQDLNGRYANWMYTRLKTGITSAITGLTGNCEPLRPAVIDFAGATLTNNTTAKTWNGVAVPATYTFMDLLAQAVRRIRDFQSQTPLIANSPWEYGDAVLLVGRAMAQCILDAYVCYKYCPDSIILNDNARAQREQIQNNSQFFADLNLDGIIIPVIVSDVVEPSVAMLLVRKIGAMNMIESDAWDWRVPTGAADAQAVAQKSGAVTYENGIYRGLTYFSPNEDCYSEKMWLHPRICMPGIVFQTLFVGLNCASPYTPGTPVFTYPGCPVVVTPQTV